MMRASENRIVQIMEHFGLGDVDVLPHFVPEVAPPVFNRWKWGKAVPNVRNAWRIAHALRAATRHEALAFDEVFPPPARNTEDNGWSHATRITAAACPAPPDR